MATYFSTYTRLGPRANERDLEAGFESAIYDPLWFLGRQWQMGEHQGENASSPVWVEYTLHSHPIETSDRRFDPSITPAEMIVESEIDDWWTMGRRVRIGKNLTAALAAEFPEILAEILADKVLCFVTPTPPYEHFKDHLDGRAVWRCFTTPTLPYGYFGDHLDAPNIWRVHHEFLSAHPELLSAADVPEAQLQQESLPAWQNENMIYQQNEDAAFISGGHKLIVNRHRGGRMDWHSVNALAAGDAVAPTSEKGEVIPTQLHYPGAPANRWWQIEDAEVDVGGYAPDSAHIATAFLTDLIFSHSDDWFLFPVSSKQQQFLFSVGLEFQSDLDQGLLSAELRQEFEVLGISLSGNTVIVVELRGSKWRVEDANHGQTYRVNSKDGKLNIYQEHNAENEGHRAGNLVAIDSMTVWDAFDRVYGSSERKMDEHGDEKPRWQGLQPPEDWTLFKIDGEVRDGEPAEKNELRNNELLLWHVAEMPLESVALERVQFGLDEESNLLWAVERTIDGRDVAAFPPVEINDEKHPKFNNGKPSGDARKAKDYAYVPAQGIVPYWHPYQFLEEEVEHLLHQKRLVDLSRQKPALMPAPRAEVLQSKTILPLAIPSNGIEIERRWQLARDMNGQPVLWIQRQRRTLLSPPARRLRFDVMEEAAVAQDIV